MTIKSDLLQSSQNIVYRFLIDPELLLPQKRHPAYVDNHLDILFVIFASATALWALAEPFRIYGNKTGAKIAKWRGHFLEDNQYCSICEPT